MSTVVDEGYSLDAQTRGRLEAGVAARTDDLVRISHTLHAHPEVAWEEHGSCALISRELAAAGFDIDRNAGGLPTAFLARAGRPDAGTRVAIVAEYDALPEIGHACGHNIIAAAAVGAATALGPLLEELDLAVTVVGSPAEEGGGGKIALLNAGVFNDYDAAMMVHPGPEDRAWARPFAVAHFDVTYRGAAAHAAAYPWRGVNAADAFTLAQTAIGLLRQQLPEDTRVHGIVTHAGTAPNVIPDHAMGKWYVRATNLDELASIYDRVVACFEAGAKATGCTLEIEETSDRYSDFVNDEDLLATFARECAIRGRDLRASDAGRTGMNAASTDMGNVSHRIAAIHPYLGIASLPAVNHQREFADATISPAGDRAVVDGAIAMACTTAALARHRRPTTGPHAERTSS